jgi:hypothetical protein
MKRLILLLAAHGLFITSAQAAFLSGFGSWSLIGDTTLVDEVAFTTSAFALGTDDATNQNVSGIDPAPLGDLEEFVGLTFDGFSLAGFDVSEGSALKQTFNLSAGEVFSFDWEYLTNDLIGDFAFLVLDGTLVPLADSTTAIAGGAYGFSHSVAGTYVSDPAAADGMVTLALGVADTGDFSASSALRVPSINAVPETGPGIASLGAVALLGACRRRLRSK